MYSKNEIKRLVGHEAAKLVQQGMTIGIGSGSTVFYFIEALSERIADGLRIKAVPSSEQSRLLSVQKGVNIINLNDIDQIDITVDGADEIDPQLQLIKGGGGALLQEKMVASASKQLVIIADDSKLVSSLGVNPLPVEVIPYGWKQVQRHIQKTYSIRCDLREMESKPFITDHGHYILDCFFQQIVEPLKINIELHLIAGVVETGLFINMAGKAIIGYPDGSTKWVSHL